MRANAVVSLVLGLAATTGPALPAEPFEGQWASDPAACAVAPAWPLVVTLRWLTWPGVGCRIGTSYRIGDVWHIGARCWGEGAVASVPIRLEMRGERLILDWGQARPEELHRCP